MKKWFLILCVLSSLWACNDKETPDKPVNPVVPEEEVPHASLTILAYFVANNNLDDDLLENIGTMYDGLSKMNQPATLLIYWDGKTAMGPNGSTHHILKYEMDEKGLINGVPVLNSSATLSEVLNVGEIVKEYPHQLSTQKSVMSQVLKDMVAMSPTERLGFVAGSHASSWINSIYTSSSRSFGQDGSGTDNTILLKDMVDAIKSTNKKFDFILFDACYMATAEVNYEFREVADYLISSVMEVPAYGFPYDETLPHLYAGKVEEYQKVCQSYIDYYTDLAWGTISLFDCTAILPLTQMLKNEIVNHKDLLADYDPSDLQDYGKTSGPDIAYDLGQFVASLNEGQLPVDFQTQLDKTVLYKGCIEDASPRNYGVDPANYSGIGIYIPVESRSKWNQYLKTIEWYTVSGWSEVDFSWNF